MARTNDRTSPLRVHTIRSPEDLERLRSLVGPDVEMTTGEDIPDPARFEILVAGRPTREQVEASPELRALLIPFAGIPPETRELMRDFPHVAVHNLHHNAAPTAEMAITLLCAAAKRIVPMDRDLRRGEWSGRIGNSPAILLEGKTAVVLGYGAIGRRLAPILRAMGMGVMAIRRSGDESTDGDGTRVLPVARLGEALPDADVLLVTAPMTDETKGLLGAEEIARLPEGAVVVNVARGPILDEEALYEALESGRIGAAGLDVWYRYPGKTGDPKDTPPADRPFGEMDNVVLSPHRAGAVLETEALREEHLAATLLSAARGEPMPHRVDLDAGY